MEENKKNHGFHPWLKSAGVFTRSAKLTSPSPIPRLKIDIPDPKPFIHHPSPNPSHQQSQRSVTLGFLRLLSTGGDALR
jgi:hypothetical protein